jgi:ryanodine receptor 2
VASRLEQNVPALDAQLAEIDRFLEEGKQHLDHPYVIDVLLPFLCAYLPTWWHQGPDNVDPKGGSHVTMVTSDHLNHLLKLILKLIMKNIGDEKADWLTNIAVHAQQIIINTSEELLKDPILPLAEKCRKRVEATYHKEESCRGYLKAAVDDASQVEGEIQEEWSLIAKDIYAFYPLLIKYVDLQKSQWIRQNVSEAESLYNHVGEIFNILTTSTVIMILYLLNVLFTDFIDVFISIFVERNRTLLRLMKLIQWLLSCLRGVDHEQMS